MYDRETRNIFNEFHKLLNEMYEKRKDQEFLFNFISKNKEKFEIFLNFIKNIDNKPQSLILTILRIKIFLESGKNCIHDSYNKLYEMYINTFIKEYKKIYEEKDKKTCYIFYFKNNDKKYIKYSKNEYDSGDIKREGQFKIYEENLKEILKKFGKQPKHKINGKKLKKIYLFNEAIWKELNKYEIKK